MKSSLDYYADAEKRYVSPCIDRGFQCALSVSPDVITETGTMMGSDGQILLQKLTEINRRTGTMRVVMVSDLGEQAIFEGACQKGQAPPDEMQRF